ncbi:MAG: (d)CMP kinase [Desulfurococcaceae archaeon]
MKIAVSGPPGSGKTTLARALAERFGLKYFSAGQVFRDVAARRGVSLEQLSLIAVEDPSIDLEIDKRTLELASQDCVVLDGHLTAWIAKDLVDIKIFVTAPLLVRVRRIAERDGKPFEDALREVLVRERAQKARYMELYGIDVDDLRIFDLVINSAVLGVEDMVALAASFVSNALKTRRDTGHGASGGSRCRQ